MTTNIKRLKSRQSFKFIGVACGLLALSGCLHNEAKENADFNKLCQYINAQNNKQPVFKETQVRYVERSLSQDAPPDWRATNMGPLCGPTCGDLVGYKGVHVYIYVSRETYSEFEKFKTQYGKGKSVFEDNSLTAPGVYEYYPDLLVNCPQDVQNELIDLNDKQIRYNFCVNSRRIEDPDSLTTIDQLPLILNDTTATWLPLPPNKPKYFFWSGLLRVFDSHNHEIMRGVDAMVVDRVGGRRCSGNNRPSSQAILYRDMPS